MSYKIRALYCVLLFIVACFQTHSAIGQQMPLSMSLYKTVSPNQIYPISGSTNSVRLYKVWVGYSGVDVQVTSPTGSSTSRVSIDGSAAANPTIGFGYYSTVSSPFGSHSYAEVYSSGSYYHFTITSSTGYSNMNMQVRLVPLLG